MTTVNPPNSVQTDVLERRYLLMKRGLYYRPNNSGYTGIKANAGRYFEREAHPEAGVTAIHEDDAPLYTDECFSDLMREHATKVIEAQAKEIERLREGLIDCADAAERGWFAQMLRAGQKARALTNTQLQREGE